MGHKPATSRTWVGPAPSTCETTDRVLERNVGAFAIVPRANDWGTHTIHCCTGSPVRAIYYAWQSILHHESGRLQVNLLMNRVSRWVDTDSHIPYVGQVDVRIWEPVDLSIKIPEWVKPGDVRVQVNGEDRRVGWDCRYAEVGEVKPGDVATMTFSICERIDTVWIEKEKHSLVRTGNDVVAIDPLGEIYPLYQREQYRQNGTRLRKMKRFVSDESIHW